MARAGKFTEEQRLEILARIDAGERVSRLAREYGFHDSLPEQWRRTRGRSMKKKAAPSPPYKGEKKRPDGRYHEAFKQEVVTAHKNGMEIGACGKFYGVPHATILYWMHTPAQRAAFNNKANTVRKEDRASRGNKEADRFTQVNGRRSYPESFKRKVAQAAEHKPQRTVGEHFGIAPGLVSQWRRKYGGPLPDPDKLDPLLELTKLEGNELTVVPKNGHSNGHHLLERREPENEGARRAIDIVKENYHLRELVKLYLG